ncbi:MAG: hypothetical protein AB1798_03770 [Spirochaetota bacterium]
MKKFSPENLDDINLSKAELKRLLDRAVTRFENWKIQMETNPNPRMVHSLKNIIAIIDNLSKFSEKKVEYSYKRLSQHMSLLMNEVASLNMAISSSLKDDLIDEREEEKIINSLMKVIQSALDLIRIVQEGFGIRKKQVKVDINLPALRKKM